MTFQKAAIASIRFGFGARPGEIERRAHGPERSLIAELENPDRHTALFGTRPDSALMVARFMRERDKGGNRAIIRLFKQDFRQTYLEEAAIRTAAAARSSTPFVERLVHFWSNHFTVSARRPILAGLAGAYEREAIRTSINGRFEDMLLAVIRHPAMILYLDNALSVGPGSAIAERRGIGMNENLAREVLELHTLGVNGGYGQEDVVELAKMLTGWSIARPNNSSRPGTFRFYGRAHEPGSRTLLGRHYPEDGAGQAEAALRDLARHPATVHHISRKLVRHFTDDAPAATDVEHIMRTWRETGGSLPAIHAAVVGLASAWRPLTKLKTPNDLLISTLRAADFGKAQRWTVGALDVLGQAPWNAPSPRGWADTATAWLSADQAMRRIEFASRLGDRAPLRGDPRDISVQALGPLLSRDTEQAISRAESPAQGLALALAAPAFQRR